MTDRGMQEYIDFNATEYLSMEARRVEVDRLRKEGLSQYIIAEIVGVSQSTIRDDLKKNPNHPAIIIGRDAKLYHKRVPRHNQEHPMQILLKDSTPNEVLETVAMWLERLAEVERTNAEYAKRVDAKTYAYTALVLDDAAKSVRKMQFEEETK